ncbi:MAG: hypothetical protein WC378_15425 [Opitutaceae bacterium]|jgi:hypothetical protein
MKLKSSHIGIFAALLVIAALAIPALIVPLGICALAVCVVAIASANGCVYLRRRGHTHAINTLPFNIGSSRCSRRYRATAALATAYTIVKIGADDQHCAAVTATADKPLGVITDEAAAAEDPINVELLGVTDRTLPMVAGGVIAALNADVYMTASGKVVIKPTAAGTYWRIGTNLTTAGADGDMIEVATTKPRKLIVIAALGNVNSAIGALTSSATTTQAEFNALRDACETLADDVRAVAAALNGDADVALATT